MVFGMKIAFTPTPDPMIRPEIAFLSGNAIKHFYPLRVELKNVVKTIKMFCKRLHNSDLFVLLPSKTAAKTCLWTEFKTIRQ
jgi:hypothetical protein